MLALIVPFFMSYIKILGNYWLMQLDICHMYILIGYNLSQFATYELIAQYNTMTYTLIIVLIYIVVIDLYYVHAVIYMQISMVHGFVPHH